MAGLVRRVVCRCGKAVAVGEICACRKRARQAADRMRPTARERGYSSRWEREAKAFLALPGNQRCACGCGGAAEVVDHIRAHKGDQTLFWDRTNWQPMTRACNSRKAAREERGQGRRTTDARTQT